MLKIHLGIYSEMRKLKFYQVILISFFGRKMPKGTSFDLLKKLSLDNKITFESIFVTGEKESTYVINALKFSAIDYLYKPLDDD